MAIQKARAIEVKTPLGTDKLLFRRMTAVESIGRLFRFDLDLLSEDDAIAPADLLGQSVTIRFDLPDGGERFFNGVVSRFSQLGRHGRYPAYQATLRPWFWLLTRTAHCRIFQQKKIPDIIKEVLRDNGFSDIKDDLSAEYRTWDYLVQYRETDFNFVNRLFEQAGCYYYFRHEDGKHTLVMTDGTHEPITGYEEIPFFPPDEHDRRERDHIFDWMLTQEVQSGAYVLNDYDFEKPKADMEVTRRNPQSHVESDREIYDYPGEYVETNDGTSYVQARLEELQVEYEQARGAGNARGMNVGSCFTLTGFPREDQNREYLVLSTNTELQSNEYESGEGEQIFSVSFSALPSSVPFRLARTTPKPTVQGPQTALVVGKSGEEIFTDKYGRVKVQFHWDREGKRDENSSCWVRVAQVWAGKQWGAIHIPRIGQEVIVDFLEGDPDRPIITGRVYNADQMPPYSLPDNMTQSGIKSRSSKKATPDNFNEIRFEDKKGEEQLFVHAEKNQDIEVENDETHWVGHDRTKTIDNDETTHVKHDRTETVDNNEMITIHANRTETVDKDETITIHANRTETVDKDETITVHGAVSVSVDKNVSNTIKGAKSEKVQKDETVAVDGDKATMIGKNDTLNVGKNLTITAADQISLTTGSASIVMKKDGTITIKGKDITIQGSGKIVGKASKDVVLKGKKILQN